MLTTDSNATPSPPSQTLHPTPYTLHPTPIPIHSPIPNATPLCVPQPPTPNRNNGVNRTPALTIALTLSVTIALFDMQSPGRNPKPDPRPDRNHTQSLILMDFRLIICLAPDSNPPDP